MFCKSLFYPPHVHIKDIKLTISVNFKTKFNADFGGFLSRCGVFKIVDTIFCKPKNRSIFSRKKYLIFCLPFKNRIRIITS